MTIHFGNDFDSAALIAENTAGAGVLYAGPAKLLHWLEAQLGLAGQSANTDYLRIELYRQALGQVNAAFYAQSFAADRFATAAYLLGWRDELLLGGWNFEKKEGMPERLEALASVEANFRVKTADPSLASNAQGFADRFELVLKRLQTHQIPLQEFVVNEPISLQLPCIQRFVQLLPSFSPNCTLRESTPPNTTLHPDVEIIVVKCRRDSDAATFLAQTLRENPSLKPTFLTQQPSLPLELSLKSEGFPSMGMLSASLARPSLQILKLAPAFLWEPIDVFKIMEFLTLPVKPLEHGLALEIARVMAEKPGFFSDAWYATVFGYLENAELPDEARAQYEFWFDRRRYPADKTAPKRDAMALYAYLQEWASIFYEESGSTNASLLVLAEQARRIHELLETLPEQRIGFLELERIVRTIFEASPIQLAPAESGSFAFVHKTGAIATKVENLVWWNFLAQNETPPPDKWQRDERAWLVEQGTALQNPRQISQLNQLQQQRPLQWVSQRLILVVPEQADGAEALPHLLMSDLEVALGRKFSESVFHLEVEKDRSALAQKLTLPQTAHLPVRDIRRPRPHLIVKHPETIADAVYETPTNLESLFYYPHRWFFRQKLRLFPSSLLSVTSDNTLLGSLAHRFFENLLQENLEKLDRKSVGEWVDAQAENLLPKEGATLLLYGREPERNVFLNRVKNAAWSLISLLRSNGWTVHQTEMPLEGMLMGMPMKGKADLVVQRGSEMAIIDLKWSGANRRKELIINGEDLQLVLYARLLPPEEMWPHTAYFILEQGRMIARNPAAFKEAIVAGRGQDNHAEVCAAIFEKMANTYNWRLDQIRRGMVEIRTSRTAVELEALYEGQLFDLLEMKDEDARWDDYRVLIGN